MASEHERRLTEYEAQVDQLQENNKKIKEKVVVLRKRQQDENKQMQTISRVFPTWAAIAIKAGPAISFISSKFSD